MGWLDWIVQGFIMTFGITQPTQRSRRIANLFIGVLLGVLILGLIGMIALGVRQFVR